MAIAQGLRAAQLTGGDVDPTVGTAMRLIGYDVDFASVASTGEPLVLTVQPIPGWRSGALQRAHPLGVHPARRRARPRRHRQGAGGRPGRRGCAAGARGGRRAGEPRRRHRAGRGGARRRLVDPGVRRQHRRRSTAARSASASRRARWRRRARGRAAGGAARCGCTTSSTRAPGTRRQRLAPRDSGGRHVRRRQHRVHGVDRAQRCGGAVARGLASALAPGRTTTTRWCASRAGRRRARSAAADLQPHHRLLGTGAGLFFVRGYAACS